MARSNRGGVFGLIRGSVGPATYSIAKTANGRKQQIVREKPTEVSNPRTRAQALQRMKLKPIFFAQNLMKDIVDHSFQGIQNGVPSLRHFLSLAMKENDIPYLNKGAVDTAIGGYIVSDGDLGDAKSTLVVNADSFDEQFYNEPMPGCNFRVVESDVDFNTFPRTVTYSYDGTYATFVKILTNLVGVTDVKEGQEIAVLTFINRVLSGSLSVEMRKIRCLMNSSYRVDTDAAYTFTKGSGDAALSIPSNMCQALCEYNPAYATEITDLAKALVNAATTPASGTDEEKILEVQKAVDYKLFIYVMGLSGGWNNGAMVGNCLTGWTGKANTTRDHAKLAPKTITEASVDGSVAAVALIVSQRINGNWHFSQSDICLTQGYRLLVNSDVRFENAIASYMVEDGASTSLSDKFLHLEDYGYDLRQAAFSVRYRQNGAGNILTAQVIGGANVNPDEANVLFSIENGNVTNLCSPGGQIIYDIQPDWLVDNDFLIVDYNDVTF